MINGAGELAHWLITLIALLEDLITFPVPTWRLTTVTAVPGDPLPPSDLHRHQAHTWYTDIPVGKHNKIIKRFK